MNANSTPNSHKLTPKSAMKIKKLLLSGMFALTCLNPSMVLAQSSEIRQLQQRQQDYKVQADNLSTKIGFYVIANLQPSAAVLASGGGVAAILGENIDPSIKAALLVAAAIGVNYCLDSQNMGYCAKVATELTGYAVELNNYNRAIDSISQQINSLQQ
jgi:hypothetical protein